MPVVLDAAFHNYSYLYCLNILLMIFNRIALVYYAPDILHFHNVFSTSLYGSFALYSQLV